MKLSAHGIAILFAIGSLQAGPQKRQDTREILVQIEMAKAKILGAPDATENKLKSRLNQKLDGLKKLVTHIAKTRTASTATAFKTLWIRMDSVEGRSAVYPELLMRILEMPFEDLVQSGVDTGIVSEVPGSTRGCCAIDSYYKFVHEKTTSMPDEIILAFRVRLRTPASKAAKGLQHGIMIELVDRGFYDSYNGYRCSDNKVAGCRITPD